MVSKLYVQLGSALQRLQPEGQNDAPDKLDMGLLRDTLEDDRLAAASRFSAMCHAALPSLSAGQMYTLQHLPSEQLDMAAVSEHAAEVSTRAKVLRLRLEQSASDASALEAPGLAAPELRRLLSATGLQRQGAGGSPAPPMPTAEALAIKSNRLLQAVAAALAADG